MSALIKTAVKRILFLFISIQSICAQNIRLTDADDFISTLESRKKTMGSVTVMKQGKVMYERQFGFARLEGSHKIPFGKNPPFMIGSATKMFTAVMILQLVQEGKIHLNDRVNLYVKEIKSNTVLIKHLLNHTSGLYDYVNDVESDNYLLLPVNKETIIRKIANEPLSFKPGSRFRYCNSGYYLLALILEKTTGKSYAQNSKERITQKLGMQHTSAELTEIIRKELSKPYSYNPFTDAYSEIKDYHLQNITGTGNMLASTIDLCIFISDICNGQLVNDSSLQLMKRAFPNSQFGSGLMKLDFNGKTAYGHGGDTKGTHTGCFYFPDDSLAISYCLNSGDYLSNNFAIGLLSKLFRDTTFSIRKTGYALNSMQLNNYTGTYMTEDHSTVLKFSASPKNKSYLSAETEGSLLFFEACNDSLFVNEKYGVDIVYNTSGKELWLLQGGERIHFKKRVP